MAGSRARERVAPSLSRLDLAILTLLTGAGLGLRLAIAWQSVPTLIHKTLPDDAFYYFGIARHIIAGHGSTFDGIHATNGYHPLWLAVLLPVYAFHPGDALSVHLAMSLCAVFGAATVVAAFVVARDLTSRSDVSLLAAGFVALHAPLILQSMNGLESALSLLLLAIALLIFVRIARGVWSGPRAWAALGGALGLVMLSRTDYVLFAAIIVVALPFAVPARDRLRAMAATVAVAAAVLSPWLIWNLVTFGTIVQDSGRALPYIEHQSFLGGHASMTQALHHSYELVRETVTVTIPRNYFVRHDFFRRVLLASVPVALAALIVLLRPGERRRLWRTTGPLVPALAAVAALVVANAGVRWYLRPWYFLAVVPVAALLLAAALAPVLERLRPVAGALLLSAVVLGLTAGFAYRGAKDWQRGLYFCPTDTLAEAWWLNANLSAEDRAGSFNAGALGYFSHRSVVDLDGVVNNSVFPALQHKTLYAYLQQERITYLVDPGYFVDHAYGPYWGSGIEQITPRLERVTSFSACGPDFPWGTAYVFRVPPAPAARRD